MFPSGYDHRSYDVLDSTNEEARRLINEGLAGPTWIHAKSQSAGRGRRGRDWVSEEGNLFATLALPLACTPAEAATLAFVSALAVGAALEAFVEAQAIHYKWPNDVLIEDKKVAGILLETQAQSAGQVQWLAIGIGINLVSAPTQTTYPATSLHLHSEVPIALEDVLSRLAKHFDHWFRVWQTQGFEPIRRAWTAQAARLNQSIEVRLPKKTLHGVHKGLDKSGALILELEDGSETIVSAGEIYF